MTPNDRDTLDELEVFLRMLSRMDADLFSDDQTHEAILVFADRLEEILEAIRDD